MSLKAKIDVFPFERYILQDPSVVSVIQAVVRGGGGGVGAVDGAVGAAVGSVGSGSGSGAAKRRGDTNSTANSGGGGGHPAPLAEWRPKTPLEKLMSLKARCRSEQRVRSVEAVLLVHIHDHPHVVLLRHASRPMARRPLTSGGTGGTGAIGSIGGTGGTGADVSFSLPGGRCRAGEAEEAALLRKLGRRLLGDAPAPRATGGEEPADAVVDMGAPRPAVGGAAASAFRVGEVLARWYRPHFEPFMYPYVPAHITENDVSEVRTVFLVHMPPHMVFTMMHTNVELIVAPLFDLYENASKYGPIIAAIPTHISRVNINYCK